MLIISWSANKGSVVDSIITEWLPLHLTGRVKSFYYPLYSDLTFPTTLFIVPKALAITGMTSDNPSHNRYSALHTDLFTVEQCTWIFKHMQAKCRPLVELTAVHEAMELFDLVDSKQFHRNDAYFYVKLPLLLASSEAILQEVLSANKADKLTVEKCLQYHQRMTALLYNDCTNRQFYHLEELKNLASLEYRIDPLLSALLGMPIEVTKKHFMQSIQVMSRRIKENAHWEIALISCHEIATSMPVQLWVEKNNSVLAWSSDDTFPYAASALEPTVVNAFYHIYDRMWHTVPKVFRDRNWVLAELEKL
ncbi:hypothetical protein F9B85_04305 [Heliorestis acidaminivorans]|uniref:Uncharacterized protein n=1 Tax=Heliorestis acidaminivorans TaxID=553427 RepID=A0A6I0F380_9FIRM|nr:hypothetical protein [Heliorestis acidaminivorans]KAB2953843.1 hypothetical protein F9B85_04305 [Heliorestis acidaminivorans]